MGFDKRIKRQLFINVVLMLFTLLTLVSCVVAWFTTNQSANVDGIGLEVERAEVKLLTEITTIEFSCTTTLADTVTTPIFFDTECAVVKEYVIEGKGLVNVDVEIDQDVSPGMLAYVCDDVQNTQVYHEMITKLETKLGADHTAWSFDDLQKALQELNSRYVGETNADGNTVFRIVYWVEYEEILTSTDFGGDAYWLDTAYEAKITVST